MSILDRVGRTPLVELRNIAVELKVPVLVPHRRVLTPMNETGYESRRSLEHRGRIFYGA